MRIESLDPALGLDYYTALDGNVGRVYEPQNGGKQFKDVTLSASADLAAAENSPAPAAGKEGGGGEEILSNLETGDMILKNGREIVGTNFTEIKPTQDAINPKKVDEYVHMLYAGEKLEPIEAVDVPSRGIYIIDGHHRYVASQKSGIPIEIRIIRGNGPIGLPDWSEVQWLDYISEDQFWGN